MEGIPFLTSLDVLIRCSLVDALFRRGWRNRASLQGCIIWSSTNSSLCMLTKLAYLPIQLQVNLRLLCSTVVLMFKCCCGKTAQENLEFILAHVKFDKLCFPESHNPLTCSFFFTTVPPSTRLQLDFEKKIAKWVMPNRTVVIYHNAKWSLVGLV